MLDQKIIDMHQCLVDESRRQPAWWFEHAALAFIAADLLAPILSPSGVWNLAAVVLTLAIGCFATSYARHPAILALVGKVGAVPRYVVLAFLMADLLNFTFNTSFDSGAHLIASVALASCFYFAACQAPRPRRRRQGAAQGNAA